jgi:dTDP-4-amino-4,6-dideoxygalactose transaminase
MDEREIEAVTRVIQSGWLTGGPCVKELEQRIAGALGAGAFLCVATGTAALHLALLAPEIGPGDEVLVPSYTFAATANTVEHVGATPVFVDVDERTSCIDLEDARRKITPRTRALVVVHFGGYPADVVALRALCDERGILLIEDAAHAFGARRHDRAIGGHGDFVCFSFYATKTLTTGGEGGGLVVNNPRFVERTRLLAWHGIDKTLPEALRYQASWRYRVELPGYKYNLAEMQAAIGLVQLDKCERMRARRQEIAAEYARGFSDLRHRLALPSEVSLPGDVHAWHLYPVRVLGAPGRDAMVAMLKERGVATSVHYLPVHQMPFYASRYPTRLPVTEAIGSSCVSLPLYSAMPAASVGQVIRAVRACLCEAAA